MTKDIFERIVAALDSIELEEDVRILYACESGSRAWGFASADSDYDVRFIYVRPVSWYLTIQHKADTIERPIDGELDLAGWDLPKALELFRRSNPPLLEWLQSPIIYRQTGSVVDRLRALMAGYYAPMACMYHYLHMAQRNDRQYLHGDRIRLKKYLYVLRPILACLWIEREYGAVPMEFCTLVDRLVDEVPLRSAIDQLLAWKRKGFEADYSHPIPEISAFLDRELARLSAENSRPADTRDPELLDRVFVEILIEAFGEMLVPIR